MRTRVPQSLYPFESHFHDLGGLRYHYLDEGEGREGCEPVVMLHGNPTWSFYYRDLIRSLRDRHRVIAPDHIGCGYSDKPSDDKFIYALPANFPANQGGNQVPKGIVYLSLLELLKNIPHFNADVRHTDT